MNREEVLQALQDFKEISGISRDKCIDIYNQFKSSDEIYSVRVLVSGKTVEIKREDFWNYINTTDIREVYSTGYTKISKDQEFETEMTKLRQEKLRSGDKLRFERTAFNKKLRTLNTLEELNKELIENIKKLKPIIGQNSNYVQNNNTDDILVVQLSDLHLLELTNEINEQNYDLEVASKRLKKLANITKEKIIKDGIKKVVIFSTGDIVNSDSITSKLLNNASNKATGIIMGVILLQHFILDIYSVCKDISYGGICSNEGRLHGTDNYFSDENLVSNAPDYIIFNMLNLLFKDISTLKYLQGRSNERVLNINGQNIVFSHGIQLKGDYGKAVANMFARYSTKGINLRFAFTGHLHASKVSNFFARSSSLTGNNSYGSNELNLNSRASQNIATISKNGDINVTPVDLQNVENICGYDIQKEVQDFCLRKSISKTNEDVIEVV